MTSWKSEESQFLKYVYKIYTKEYTVTKITVIVA